MATQTMATAATVETHDQGNDGPPWPSMTMAQADAIEARNTPTTRPHPHAGDDRAVNDQQQPAEATPGRGKNGQYTRTVDTATKDALAARLRATGAGYRVIAARLGYETASGAHKAVQRALAAVPVEDVAELRALECERLDVLTEKLWTVLNTRYPLLAPGVELVGSDGKPVADPAPILAAIDRLARISEQRARLLGLNAPTLRPPAEPKPAALELTERHAVILRRLLQALESQVDASPLALPMLDETPRETA